MISQKNFSKQKRNAGFGLAIVLLAIVLIGVISAFIAQSFEPSESLEDKEGAKLDASNIVTGGQTFESQVGTYIATNGLKGYQLFAVRATSQVNNLWRPAGGLVPPKVPTNAYVFPACSSGSTNNPTNDSDLGSASGHGDGCAWYLTRVNMGIGKNKLQGPTDQWTGSALTNDLVAYSFPLRLVVCQQINNLLYNVSLDDTPVSMVATTLWGKLAVSDNTKVWAPVIALSGNARTTTNSTEFAQSGIYDTSGGSSVAGLPVIGGEGRTEGCGNGSLGGSGANIYTYYKVVLTQ